MTSPALEAGDVAAMAAERTRRRAPRVGFQPRPRGGTIGRDAAQRITDSVVRLIEANPRSADGGDPFHYTGRAVDFGPLTPEALDRARLTLRRYMRSPSLLDLYPLPGRTAMPPMTPPFNPYRDGEAKAADAGRPPFAHELQPPSPTAELVDRLLHLERQRARALDERAGAYDRGWRDAAERTWTTISGAFGQRMHDLHELAHLLRDDQSMTGTDAREVIAVVDDVIGAVIDEFNRGVDRFPDGGEPEAEPRAMYAEPAEGPDPEGVPADSDEAMKQRTARVLDRLRGTLPAQATEEVPS